MSILGVSTFYWWKRPESGLAQVDWQVVILSLAILIALFVAGWSTWQFSRLLRRSLWEHGDE